MLPSRNNFWPHVDLRILGRDTATSTDLCPSSSSVPWDQALRPFIWVKLLPLWPFLIFTPPFPFDWFQDITLPRILLPLTLVFFCLLLNSFFCHSLSNNAPESCIFSPLFTLCSSPGVFYLFSESTIAYLVWRAKINMLASTPLLCATFLYFQPLVTGPSSWSVL